MPMFTYAPSGMSRATRTAISSRLNFFIPPRLRTNIHELQSRVSASRPLRGRIPRGAPAPLSCGLHHALHDDAGGHHGVGIELAQRHDAAHFRDGALGRRGHDGVEVARGLAIDEVAPAVGA